MQRTPLLVGTCTPTFPLRQPYVKRYIYTCTKEKIERMKKLHEKIRTTQKERDRLKAKLAKVVKCEGVNVDSTTNADIHTIAQSEAFRVVEKFSPGSFQRIYLVSAFAHVHSNMLQRTIMVTVYMGSTVELRKRFTQGVCESPLYSVLISC